MSQTVTSYIDPGTADFFTSRPTALWRRWSVT